MVLFHFRYQVFKIQPQTEFQVKALLELPHSFWKEPAVGKEAQMVVGPEDLSSALHMFEHYKLDYSLHIRDLKKYDMTHYFIIARQFFLYVLFSNYSFYF